MAQIRYFLGDLSMGQKFRSSRLTVSEAAILRFADDFDPQPFHLDDDAARQTLFGGLAASGWHTAALTMRLLVDGGLPFAGGIIGTGGEISWPRPVRPGDELRVVSEIKEIVPSQSRRDRGRVTAVCETFNQKDELVQRLVAVLVVLRAPGEEKSLTV